jgi:hypothetical protein
MHSKPSSFYGQGMGQLNASLPKAPMHRKMSSMLITPSGSQP